MKQIGKALVIVEGKCQGLSFILAKFTFCGAKIPVPQNANTFGSGVVADVTSGWGHGDGP